MAKRTKTAQPTVAEHRASLAGHLETLERLLRSTRIVIEVRRWTPEERAELIDEISSLD
jgi:hypothetical protein